MEDSSHSIVSPDGQDPAENTESGSTFPTELVDPDSFLIDDPDNPLSDDEDAKPSPTAPILPPEDVPDNPIGQAEEISLANTPSESTALPLMSPNIHKEVPLPPRPDSDNEDEEPPELYLPGLVIPTMFLPIPNVRPFLLFLSSYVLDFWCTNCLSARRIR
jgi:hypothetical protein